jgi:hypothetical protein
MSSENTADALASASDSVPTEQLASAAEQMSTVTSFIDLAGAPAREHFGAHVQSLNEDLSALVLSATTLLNELTTAAGRVRKGGAIA